MVCTEKSKTAVLCLSRCLELEEHWRNKLRPRGRASVCDCARDEGCLFPPPTFWKTTKYIEREREGERPFHNRFQGKKPTHSLQGLLTSPHPRNTGSGSPSGSSTSCSHAFRPSWALFTAPSESSSASLGPTLETSAHPFFTRPPHRPHPRNTGSGSPSGSSTSCSHAFRPSWALFTAPSESSSASVWPALETSGASFLYFRS